MQVEPGNKWYRVEFIMLTAEDDVPIEWDGFWQWVNRAERAVGDLRMARLSGRPKDFNPMGPAKDLGVA